MTWNGRAAWALAISHVRSIIQLGILALDWIPYVHFGL